MSKHNYTQYSNKKSNYNTDASVEAKEPVVIMTPELDVVPAVEEIKMEHVVPEVELVSETVETVALPETVTGVVVDCSKLNVRVAPYVTATVATVINAASEIEINVAKSTDEWFHVCTAAGIEGYCMRKFVDAKL